MFIMLIKHSLFLILISVLETCTTVSKRSHNLLWILNMIFQLFMHRTCHRNSFVATKDKFEVLHLPNLINDVQFPSLFCLSLQLESKKHSNLQHYLIIATPSGGLIIKSLMFSLLLFCSCFSEKVFIHE